MPTDTPLTSGRKTAWDATFSVGERIVSQLAQLAVFIVAARVLSPAEFGLFALASAVAALLLRAAEAGWAPFIMSRSGDITVPLQVLFIAIITGMIVGFFSGLAVLGAGMFWLLPETVALMLYFVLWVALANAASAQKGVLIWLGRLKTAALCEVAGECAALVVAISALLTGAGVFALIYGRLTAQIVTLTCSFSATRRMPSPGLPRGVRRELWVFSTQIFSARMLVHARLHFITLIIGGLLGPTSAGLFRAAERLVGAMTELIVVPGQLMAWTLLRRARDAGSLSGQAARINAQMARLLYALVMFGAPLLLWLVVMRDEIVNGLLGSAWSAAAPLVAILAIGRLLLLLGIMTEPLMSITGQARRMPGFMTVIFVVSITLTLLAAPFGLYALAWSQVAVSALAMTATVWLFARYGAVRWSIVARPVIGTIAPLLCGVATIVSLDAIFMADNWPQLIKAVAFGLSGGVVFGGVALFCDPGLRAGILGLRRSAL